MGRAASGTRIYKYRGYLITYNDEAKEWIVHSTYFGCERKTLRECKTYIDSKIG